MHHPLSIPRVSWSVDQERVSRLFDRRRCVARSDLNPIAGNDLVLYLFRASCGLSVPVGCAIVLDLEGEQLSLLGVQADSVRRKEVPLLSMLANKKPLRQQGF